MGIWGIDLGDLPGWVQAIGTVVALGLTVWIQWEQRAAQRDRERAALARALTAVNLAHGSANWMLGTLRLENWSAAAAKRALENRAFETAKATLTNFPIEQLPVGRSVSMLVLATNAAHEFDRTLAELTTGGVLIQAMQQSESLQHHHAENMGRAVKTLEVISIELLTLNTRSQPRPLLRRLFRGRAKPQRGPGSGPSAAAGPGP